MMRAGPPGDRILTIMPMQGAVAHAPGNDTLTHRSSLIEMSHVVSV